MAVWQFDFYIIKQNNVMLYNEKLSQDENEHLFDWERYKISQSSIYDIAKILPSEKSWTEHIEQYGKIDETCLKIFSSSECICQISFRLDLRNFTRKLMYEIVEFIKSNEGSIVYNNKCYPAEEDILLGLLRESNAYKFCKDAEGFLTSLETKH